jgi:hypothetical protein
MNGLNSAPLAGATSHTKYPSNDRCDGFTLPVRPWKGPVRLAEAERSYLSVLFSLDSR